MKKNCYEYWRKAHFIRAQIVYLLGTKKDNDVRELIKEQIASDYLKKRYVDKYYKKIDKKMDYLENTPEKIVWLYWKQGLSNAPSIVKLCVGSVKETFEKNGWKVKIIDYKYVIENNLLPSFIYFKYEKKEINDAHFSDLVRLCLLNKYGGCWIDSTVLMTNNKIPVYIEYTPFFCYQNCQKNTSYINISNWLISSCANNPILEDVYNILLDYWKNEKIMIQYYGFHLIFKLVSEHYPTIWKNVFINSNINPHILQTVMFEKIDKLNLDFIIKNSDFHKLTWRYPKTINKESVISKILKGEVEFKNINEE